MPSYEGKNLNVQWIHSAGTAVLSGDFRKFDYTPSVEMVDETAGSDTNKQYLVGVKDGKASFSALMQAAGSALTNALVEGAVGTIIWSPEGTASTNEKHTMPAISGGVVWSIPYRGVVEISVDFQQNGARTDGSW